MVEFIYNMVENIVERVSCIATVERAPGLHAEMHCLLWFNLSKPYKYAKHQINSLSNQPSKLIAFTNDN